MLRGLPTFVLLSAIQAFGGNIQMLPPLPNGGVARAVQVDAGGNIYVAGPQNGGNGFVAKLAPDGSTVMYWTVIPGAGVNALAIGSDGSAYVTGIAPPNFPTTPGAMQSTIGSSEQAFAARFDPNGKAQYATYIGGPAQTQGTSIAIDAAGNAYATEPLFGNRPLPCPVRALRSSPGCERGWNREW
jgi:hypothetical protein